MTDDADKTGAPLFPDEGPFNPVVPLSEIGGEVARAAPEQGDGEEAATLIRPRARRAAPPAPAHEDDGRASFVQSWPATLLVVGLSLVAGMLAGVFLLGARRTAETHEPATAVEEAARADETTLTDAHAPETAAEPEPSPAPRAAEPDEPAPVAAGVKPSAGASAPVVNAPEARRETAAETPARKSEERVSARSSSSPRPAAPVNTADTRRASAPAPAPRRTEPRVAPRDTQPPVFSPTPRPDGKKVIPWP
ncbi:MAG TPA: hypothetical protein VD968_08785 [Pyrinomonadaceae bacterium]|nr:hypothetical protein [Pyrinomonadaceae bacterium]